MYKKSILIALLLSILVMTGCDRYIFITEPKHGANYLWYTMESNINWDPTIKEGSLSISLDGRDWACAYAIDYSNRRATAILRPGAGTGVTLRAEALFWNESKKQYERDWRDVSFKVCVPYHTTCKGPIPDGSPSFCLDPGVNSTLLNPGGTGKVYVKVVPWFKYSGDVQVTAVDLPVGISSDSVTVGAGGTAVLTLTADPAAPIGRFDFKVKGQGPIGTIVSTQYKTKPEGIIVQ